MASVALVKWSTPAIIAGAFGAAFVVASGVFFVEALFQAPPPERPPIVVETTGRATPVLAVQEPAAAQPAPAEVAGSADCQAQTWPHIARPCLASEKGVVSEQGPRGVRMITTDKLAEPAVSVIEKPPANMIHPMPPPPASPQRSPLFPAHAAVPPLSGSALSALAFGGRFKGIVETEKFEVAAVPTSAAEPVQPEAKPEKPVAQKSAVNKTQAKQAKQKSKRQIARSSDRQKARPVAVTSRTDNSAGGFSSASGGFPSGGPFGALFGSRSNQ